MTRRPRASASRSGWLRAVCAVALCAASGAAAGEAPPPVSWDDVEAWALGKSGPEAKSEKPAPKPAEGQPQKAPGPPKEAPPEDPARKEPPPEAVALWKRPSPTSRRPDPKAWQELQPKLPPLLLERPKDLRRNGEFDRLYELYFNLERYDLALQAIAEQIGDPKVAANEDRVNRISGQFWRAAILHPTPIPQAHIDGAYQKWRSGLRPPPDAKEFNEYVKEQEDMYKLGRKLIDELKAQEFQGDERPEPLWELIRRFEDERPANPLGIVRAGYKLREWFPEFEKVKKGEVQQRITSRLHWPLQVQDAAAEEGLLMLQQYPEHSWVKNGDATWTRAEDLRDYGYSLQSYNKAIPYWQQAVAHYQEFKKHYPNHSNNKITQTGQTQPLSVQRIGELEGKLGRHK